MPVAIARKILPSGHLLKKEHDWKEAIGMNVDETTENQGLASNLIEAMNHIAYLLIKSDRLNEIFQLLKIQPKSHSTVTQISSLSKRLINAIRTILFNHPQTFLLTFNTFKGDEYPLRSYLRKNGMSILIKRLTLPKAYKSN